MREAQKAWALRASQGAGTAGGSSRRVAAGTAERTHLEKKRNWSQLKELGRRTVQLQPGWQDVAEESQGVLSLFHSLPSFFFSYSILGTLESVCVAAEKRGTGRSRR